MIAVIINGIFAAIGLGFFNSTIIISRPLKKILDSAKFIYFGF